MHGDSSGDDSAMETLSKAAVTKAAVLWLNKAIELWLNPVTPVTSEVVALCDIAVGMAAVGVVGVVGGVVGVVGVEFSPGVTTGETFLVSASLETFLTIGVTVGADKRWVRCARGDLERILIGECTIGVNVRGIGSSHLPSDTRS